MVNAVVFSGGSWYGLSAATGVANGIRDLKAAEGNVDFIAGVVAAIIYDVGGRRFSRVTPDDRLGIAALQSAREGWFPLGARGAGRFAMQGVYYLRGKNAERFANWPHSGQGGAFRAIGTYEDRRVHGGQRAGDDRRSGREGSSAASATLRMDRVRSWRSASRRSRRSVATQP
jgi:hypothetical protein